MNQDRELLELAARAAGHACDWFWSDNGRHGAGMYRMQKNTLSFFNPMQDDGDCARLEAYLKLNVEWCGSFVLVSDSESSIECSEHFISHDDGQAARRTASVRVAAEIQRAKEAA